MRSADNAAAAPSGVPAVVGRAVGSAGQPLEAAAREQAEARFGHDFSRVRVHDDLEAADSAAAVKANAYTVGHHIAFAAGRYRPKSDAGFRLLAHELAHVVQNHNGGESNSAESRAERAAEHATRGRPVDSAALGGPWAAVARQPETGARGDHHHGQGHASAPPCKGVRACMSLSSRKAWLLTKGDHVVRGPVPAMGGRESAPTPVGRFRVTWHDRHHHSKQFNAPMPYAVFFHEGSAFHQGSPSVPSHGCVHLANADAKAFYEFLKDGDPVEITK